MSIDRFPDWMIIEDMEKAIQHLKAARSSIYHLEDTKVLPLIDVAIDIAKEELHQIRNNDLKRNRSVPDFGPGTPTPGF